MDSDGDSSNTSPKRGGDETFTVAAGVKDLVNPITSAITQAVANLPSLVPEIAPMGAESALAAEEDDHLARGGSLETLKSKEEDEDLKGKGPALLAKSEGWPLVSDSEEDGEEDVIKKSNRNKYPKISDELSTRKLDSSSGEGALDRPLSTVIKSLKETDESGEDSGLQEEMLSILRAHEPSHLGEDESVKDILDDEGLKDLMDSPVEEGDLLSGLGSMSDADERQMRRLGPTHGLEENESSSGSVSDSKERERNSSIVTRELLDDWLEVEDTTSALGSEVQMTNGLDYTPVRPLSPRESGSRKVYKFPKQEDESLAAAEEGGTELLAWPVGLMIQVIGFQVKLLVHSVYFALWVCSFTYAAMMFPFRMAKQATNVVSTTVRDGYTMATQIKPMLKEGVAQAGPILMQTTKKCGCGCLAAVYVSFMLGSLLFPALFLDFFLMRGFIEEPVEFRQVLHFDYTQERPSAIMPLLPPNVLAKAKDYAISHPEKVFRVRAIPPSHKFHVTVYLTLPESEYNRRLGMFQVSGELLSVRGQVLKRTSWPCMLPFRSSPIRYAKNLLLGVPLLMGLSWESQTLALRLFENEREKTIPTALVRFAIEPKAGYPVGAGLPEVYNAEAEVVSVLPWAKELVRKWKWTFYVWSGLSLFMFEVAMVLCCCHQVLLPSRLVRGITEGFGESEPGPGAAKEATLRKGGKHGRRVNFSDEMPTARVIRPPSNSVSPAKEPELLLSNAESDSTLTGLRSRRLSGLSTGVEDTGSEATSSRTEATSSWVVPPMEETLDYVDGKVKVVEGTVRTLGETMVEGVTEGVGLALHKMKQGLDPKALKSD